MILIIGKKNLFIKHIIYDRISMYRILATIEYLEWFTKQTPRTQGQIQARIKRILDFGHFGEAKHLENNLLELKWKNGLRVYFSLAKDDLGKLVFILCGGNKNSQRKDIKLAKKLQLEIKDKD